MDAFSLNPLVFGSGMRKAMARTARIIIPNHAYLISHNAVRRNGIFRGDDDRRFYIEVLTDYAERYEMDVLAYALLPSCVLLVAVGQKPDSISRAVGRTGMRFARFRNSSRRVKGKLWNDRFSSTMLQDTLVSRAAKYVEQAAWRARLVKMPKSYVWSSAPAHLGQRDDAILATFPEDVPDWREWLDDLLDPLSVDKFSRNLRTGRPTGSVEYLKELEQQLGRQILPRRRGPRPKELRNSG